MVMLFSVSVPGNAGVLRLPYTCLGVSRPSNVARPVQTAETKPPTHLYQFKACRASIPRILK